MIKLYYLFLFTIQSARDANATSRLKVEVLEVAEIVLTTVRVVF